MRKILLPTASLLLLLLAAGCGGVRITPRRSVLAHNLGTHYDKRAAVLAFREPVGQPGLGNTFAAFLHREMLRAGPFVQVPFHPEAAWFGLQSAPAEELATAAALGAELGFDLVIIGDIERFAYGRTSDSTMVVSVWILDTVTGEVVHAERLTARGRVRSFPPSWEPGLSGSPDLERLMSELAAEIVRRISPY